MTPKVEISKRYKDITKLLEFAEEGMKNLVVDYDNERIIYIGSPEDRHGVMRRRIAIWYPNLERLDAHYIRV